MKTIAGMNRKRIFALDFWNLMTFIFFVLIAVFLVYPLVGLLSRSIFSGENNSFGLSSYLEFFQLPYYFSTLWHSILLTLVSTVLATLVGLPMGYVVARYNIPGKKMLNVMVVISLLSPPFIGAYAWIVLLGRSGFLTKLIEPLGIHLPSIYGFGGMLLVFTFKMFPFIYMYVIGALGSMDSSLEEAAESLGVHGIKRLFTVTFPLILPTLTSSVVMVLMTVLSDLGTPMLIGEGYKVLPVLIYDEFMSEMGGSFAMASTMSVIIIVFSLTVLFLQRKIIGNKDYNMTGLRPPAVIELKPGSKIILTTVVYGIAVFALIPQITTVVTSFIKTHGPLFVKGFSFESYRYIWDKMADSIMHTFTYATIAIIIMIFMGILTAYLVVRRKSRVTALLDFLLMSPYVIPGSVLGIIFIMAFNKPPVLLAGTATILIISYVIRKIPFLFRSSIGILYQLDPAVEEASISLGISPVRTFFKVTAILMLPGVVSGAVLSWIASINEFSSTIILYSGRTKTISVAIFTEIFKDSYGTAAALGTILTLAAIVSLVIFNKLTKGKGSVV
ncbi:MAG: iron ABC transporter permease [Spirochaetes bacterium]|nr:MAG: iron ABC transporter permease [Spirochaetota bacterium]